MPSMVEEPTIKDQAGKVLGHIAGYVASRTIELGLAHGLIASLASHPDGLAAEGLASDRDLDPFYVEVWCASAFANDVLERVTDKVYRLARHMDTVLLDRGSPAYVGGTLAVVSQPDVFDRFSRTLPTGERTWWDHCSPGFIDGVSGSGGAFYVRLIPGGLSQIHGLAERLRDGARILDTACGSGVGLVRLAEAYPSASLVGADGDAYSLEIAAERLGRHDLTDRVELVHTPLEELDRDSEFDLITNNISMHECRDINRVTENIRRALRPGGYFVISDFPFPDTDEALRTVPGRIMSGIQFFEAQIDDQLLPVAAYLELLQGRGFRGVDSFQLTPVHAVTYGVKDHG
jgi:SAM-dependent methyltransferase